MYRMVLTHRSGSSRSGGAPSQLVAVMIAQLLETGVLQEHIYTTLQVAYRRRWCKMTQAITKYLIPLGVKLPQTQRNVVGGYFIWLRLPVPAAAVVQRAKAYENLIVAQGSIFQVPGDSERGDTCFPNCIRLCIASEDEKNLEEGIKRLANIVGERLREGISNVGNVPNPRETMMAHRLAINVDLSEGS